MNAANTAEDFFNGYLWQPHRRGELLDALSAAVGDGWLCLNGAAGPLLEICRDWYHDGAIRYLKTGGRIFVQPTNASREAAR